MKSVTFFLSLATLLWGDVYATYEIKPVKEASLAFNASGLVKNVWVSVAQNVKKGETLVELDREEETLHAKMAQVESEALKKEIDFLTIQYERYSKSSQVFDKNTLDKMKMELDTKTIALQRAHLSYALSMEKITKMSLKAPFAGTITEKSVEAGDLVTTMGTHPVLKLISRESKMVINFDAKYHADVHVGSLFCPKLDSQSLGSCVVIKKIYPTVNTTNRQMSAEAEGLGLKPGLFGDGMISSPKR